MLPIQIPVLQHLTINLFLAYWGYPWWT